MEHNLPCVHKGYTLYLPFLCTQLNLKCIGHGRCPKHVLVKAIEPVKGATQTNVMKVMMVMMVMTDNYEAIATTLKE